MAVDGTNKPVFCRLTYLVCHFQTNTVFSVMFGKVFSKGRSLEVVDPFALRQ